MSKILKNDSGGNITVSDTGVTIDDGTQYTIQPQDYLLWAASSDVVTEVGAGNLVVNDGSYDLSISDGIDLIKGIFPNPITVDSSQTSPVTVQTSNVDTFNRTRVSEVDTIFDYNFSNVVDFDVYWSEKLESGATTAHISDDASYQMSATTTIGSKATLQSRRHMQYFAGKSHISYFTGNPNAIQTGMRKRLGLFTDHDGYFLQIDTVQGAAIVLRKNGIDTEVLQSNWNGDKVDGTGASGIISDLTKQKLYFIEIGWLGSNSIRFGQIINGNHIIMHTHYIANNDYVPVTQTAVLPYRLEIECIGAATVADSLKITCFSYMVEGRVGGETRIRSWNSGTSSKTVNTTEKALFGIRINPIYGESSIELNLAEILLASGNSEVRWRLIHNPTLTTPVWNTETSSIAQTLDSPDTTAYTNGFVAASGYINVGERTEADLTKTDIALGHDIDGNFDIFILVVETIISTSKTLIQVSWEEFS